jgi:hypothetical protein
VNLLDLSGNLVYQVQLVTGVQYVDVRYGSEQWRKTIQGEHGKWVKSPDKLSVRRLYYCLVSNDVYLSLFTSLAQQNIEPRKHKTRQIG